MGVVELERWGLGCESVILFLIASARFPFELVDDNPDLQLFILSNC